MISWSSGQSIDWIDFQFIDHQSIQSVESIDQWMDQSIALIIELTDLLFDYSWAVHQASEGRAAETDGRGVTEEADECKES